MLRHNWNKSFVAFVECNTEGFEGYLDACKLKMGPIKGDPEGREAAYRLDADWLSVTSYKGKDPHRFWFRCFEDSAGKNFYDIQSWDRRTGRNFNSKLRHFYLNDDGFIGLYQLPPAQEQLWSVEIFEDGKYSDLAELSAKSRVASVRITTFRGTVLCAEQRKQTGDYWYGYASQKGVPLLLTLDIQDIGEELLDSQA